MSSLLGIPLLVVLIVHVSYKVKLKTLEELFFGCNAAMIGVTLGLLFRLDWLTGVSTLFSFSVGVPGYGLYVSEQRTARFISLLVHLLTPMMGCLRLHQTGLPENAYLWSFFLFVIVLHTISYYATAPRLNVNMVHSPWPPVKNFFSDKMGLYRACNASLCLGFLWAGERLLRWWLPQLGSFA